MKMAVNIFLRQRTSWKGEKMNTSKGTKRQKLMDVLNGGTGRDVKRGRRGGGGVRMVGY